MGELGNWLGQGEIIPFLQELCQACNAPSLSTKPFPPPVYYQLHFYTACKWLKTEVGAAWNRGCSAPACLLWNIINGRLNHMQSVNRNCKHRYSYTTPCALTTHISVLFPSDNLFRAQHSCGSTATTIVSLTPYHRMFCVSSSALPDIPYK